MTFGEIIALLVICLVLLVGLLFGIPAYNVWRAGMSGKAELQRAEQQKQILISQARAEKEAAELQAEAIQIVGEVAQKYPEYREQQFIQAFSEAITQGKVEMMFVPTEANIPLIHSKN